MDGEQRLWTGALEAISWGALWVPPEGWSLRTRERRQFEEWTDARASTYVGLTTDELCDVLAAEVTSLAARAGL